MEPVHHIMVQGECLGYYTAAQLQAARQQGAEEERSKTQGVSQQLIDDLEKSNAQLMEVIQFLDLALLKAYPHGCDSGEVFDLWNAARAAIEAAEVKP